MDKAGQLGELTIAFTDGFRTDANLAEQGLCGLPLRHSPLKLLAILFKMAFFPTAFPTRRRRLRRTMANSDGRILSRSLSRPSIPCELRDPPRSASPSWNAPR